VKINRCSVMGKRGFQYNDGTCHIGMSARSKAEADAAASGEAWVSFDLDGTLIDDSGSRTKAADALQEISKQGFRIAVTSARSEQARESVEKILERIGLSGSVEQIHLTDRKAKGTYFRDSGFHPVIHVDNKDVELMGLPDTTRGISVSDIE